MELNFRRFLPLGLIDVRHIHSAADAVTGLGTCVGLAYGITFPIHNVWWRNVGLIENDQNRNLDAVEMIFEFPFVTCWNLFVTTMKVVFFGCFGAVAGQYWYFSMSLYGIYRFLKSRWLKSKSLE